MKITILTENIANKKGLLAEHGLSVLVETEEERILFDVGQSDVFLRNAEQMEISLQELDGIVVSHGHYDHTEGLENYLNTYNKKKVKLFLRKEALADKRCRDFDGKKFRKIGIPWRERTLPVEFYFTKEKEEIFPNVYVLGNVPSVVGSEAKPEHDMFYVAAESDGNDKEKMLPDKMSDEQMLVVRTAEGLVIIAGCAHAGILNCMEHVKNNFPGEKMHLLLAGMHLRSCGKERIANTIEGLKQYGLETIIPVHCTGIEAIVNMKEAFGEKCRIGEVGMKITV